MLGGGIDLSVGAIFALSAFTAVSANSLLELPLWQSLLLTLAVGALAGAFNGLLIGYLRLRAFLTTLVTFILLRTLFDILVVKYASQIQQSPVNNPQWNFIGEEGIGPLPASFVLAVLVAIGLHLLLSRMRLGWHIQAVGARGARHGTPALPCAAPYLSPMCSPVCAAGWPVFTRHTYGWCRPRNRIRAGDHGADCGCCRRQ